MASETMFFFKRYEKVPKRDNEGKVIEGFIIVEAEDCINLYEVIRGWWRDNDTFMLQMKDGHEESVEKEMHPDIRAKMIERKQEIPKTRSYLASFIELRAMDVRRFKAATELLLPKEVDLPTVISPRALMPPVPTQVELTQTAAPANTETTTSTKPSKKTIPKVSPMKVVKDEKPEPIIEPVVEKTHDIDLLPIEEAVQENNEGNEGNDIAVV